MWKRLLDWLMPLPQPKKAKQISYFCKQCQMLTEHEQLTVGIEGHSKCKICGYVSPPFSPKEAKRLRFGGLNLKY